MFFGLQKPSECWDFWIPNHSESQNLMQQKFQPFPDYRTTETLKGFSSPSAKLQKITSTLFFCVSRCIFHEFYLKAREYPTQKDQLPPRLFQCAWVCSQCAGTARRLRSPYQRHHHIPRPRSSSQLSMEEIRTPHVLWLVEGNTKNPWQYPPGNEHHILIRQL